VYSKSIKQEKEEEELNTIYFLFIYSTFFYFYFAHLDLKQNIKINSKKKIMNRYINNQYL
jgi:hypothetical protein